MGNVTAVGPRRDRRREMTFLFYFVFGFVLIRVWILLIESGSVLVESIGGAVTFLLFVALYMRYRILRLQQEEFEINRNHQDVHNPDMALLQALFSIPRRGISQEIINSLYCFNYTGRNDQNVNEGNTSPPTSTRTADDSTAIQADELMLNSVVGDIENGPQNYTESDACCCSICLAEYVQNERLLMLPCRHVYHQSCVTEWLLGHSQCPLCKQDVLELLEQQLMAQTQVDGTASRGTENGRAGGAPPPPLLYGLHHNNAQSTRGSEPILPVEADQPSIIITGSFVTVFDGRQTGAAGNSVLPTATASAGIPNNNSPAGGADQQTVSQTQEAVRDGGDPQQRDHDSVNTIMYI